jgi:sulfonate transport system substrate-binding protein
MVRSLLGAVAWCAMLPAAKAQPAQPAWNAASLPLSVPAGSKLVVGDQNENLQTILTASGVRSRLVTQVAFANFLGGPEIFEAFRAGALDVALIGSTPPIHAHAAGEPIPIVAALESARPAYGLALRPGLALNSLQDLKGRKIAWAEGTARQPFILAALKRAGLRVGEVKLVPLKVADFPVAIKTGQVDVAPLNEPHLSRYLKAYAAEKAQTLPAAAHEGLPASTHYLYASRKALADPAKAAAIRELVAGWVSAVAWSQAHPADWVRAYYVRRQGLKEADGMAIVSADGELRFSPLRDTVRGQQELIDLIHDAGQLPRRLDAQEEFDLRFDTLFVERNANAGGSK